MTFAQRASIFNATLKYSGSPLPMDIRMMNPFTEYPDTLDISNKFLDKYFSDDNPRILILGINPGRLGAGLTGIPFTDPKRLESHCNIGYRGVVAHEPSSAFIYDMIDAYGGATDFYKKFYINSPCPLGFTRLQSNGKEKNFNYYDNKALTEAVTPFICDSLNKLLDLGISRKISFCLGSGKNNTFLQSLNGKHHFFDEIVALEHPRYIMQYKNASKHLFIEKYLGILKNSPI